MNLPDLSVAVAQAGQPLVGLLDGFDGPFGNPPDFCVFPDEETPLDSREVPPCSFQFLLPVLLHPLVDVGLAVGYGQDLHVPLFVRPDKLIYLLHRTHPSTTPLADAEAVVMTVEQVTQVLDLDALVEDGLDVAVVLVGLVLVALRMERLDCHLRNLSLSVMTTR